MGTIEHLAVEREYAGAGIAFKGGDDALCPIDLLDARREHLVEDGDLVGMDGDLATVAHTLGVAGLGPPLGFEGQGFRQYLLETCRIMGVRFPEYDEWLAKFPHQRPLEAKAMVSAFHRWDEEVGAAKMKK